MKIQIYSLPQFGINLTKNEIDVLMELSSHHYDSWCKQAGREGGFIFDWKREFWEENQESAELRGVTFSNLDTCLKIMECADMLYRDRDTDMDTVVRLQKAFHLATSKYNEIYNVWKIELETE